MPPKSYGDPKKEFFERVSGKWNPEWKIPQTSTNFLAITVIVSTALIIVSNLVLADRTSERIVSAIREIEYGKVGGELNYRLLQEVQREQTAEYIRQLEKERPEYVRELKTKTEEGGSGTKPVETAVRRGTLTARELEVLHRDTPALGQTGAKIAIIEFSDFECSYCREFHNEGALSGALATFGSGTVEYLFKALPNPAHQNSEFLAHAAKCAAKTLSGAAYFEMVDAAFSATGSIGDAISSLALASGSGEIDRAAFESCADSRETAEATEKDVGQGVFLRVRSTPSLVIANLRNGRYSLLEGKTDQARIEREISAVLASPDPEP